MHGCDRREAARASFSRWAYSFGGRGLAPRRLERDVTLEDEVVARGRRTASPPSPSLLDDGVVADPRAGREGAEIRRTAGVRSRRAPSMGTRSVRAIS